MLFAMLKFLAQPWQYLAEGADDPTGGGGGGGNPDPEPDPKPDDDPTKDRLDKLKTMNAEALAAMVLDLRDENAKARVKNREFETAKTAAETAAETKRQEDLAKQGEFEKLATERAEKVRGLEAQNAELTAALDAHLAAQLEAVPKDLLELIPDGAALAKLQYISTKAFQRLLEQAGRGKPAAPGADAPSNQSEQAATQAEITELEKRVRGGETHLYPEWKAKTRALAGASAT